MAYNVSQMTNYDITEDMPTSIKQIPIPTLIEGSDGQMTVDFNEQDITYIEVLSNKNIVKLGYICEPKGHIYPIYLERNGKYDQFWVSPNGTYEMQPETYLNENEEEVTTDVVITGIMVPQNIEFKIDYAIPKNIL